MSERNSILLTFDMADSDESIKASIKSRLLKVLNKNIVPASVLCVGLSKESGAQKDLIGLKKSLLADLVTFSQSLRSIVDSKLKLELSVSFCFFSALLWFYSLYL